MSWDLDLQRPSGGGRPQLYGSRFSLRSVGYVLDELLLSGTVRTYVDPGEEMPFCTRLVVIRPDDPDRADGTVVVEWLNVSGGIEAPPLWMNTHTGIIRNRHVYVGVSAQALGVEGGRDLLGQRASPGLKHTDPERYGHLRHPGDPWSYDIFAAAGAALIEDGGAALGGIRPTLVVAGGHSQSAHRLVTFANVIDTLRPVYAGYLVLGRGASSAPLGAESLRTIADGPAQPLRRDGRVPVMCVQSETDVVLLGSRHARVPDGPALRTWEVAGAAHADTYQLLASATDDGRRPIPELVDAIEPTDEPFGISCRRPINSGMQQHYVAVSALHALCRWAVGGEAPASAEPIDVVQEGLVTDDNGIARRGVRTPFVDAPSAVLSGLGQEGSSFARLFGTTDVLDAHELWYRYGSEEGYRRQVEVSLAGAVDGGFLLDADAPEALGIAVEHWRRRAAVHV